MPDVLDLYHSSYGNYELDAYRRVRIATYGEDLGQTSWLTTEESRAIPQLLGLTSASFVLEIGCGSGRYALQIAESVGCRVRGVDINAPGIGIATQLVRARNMDSQVCFQQADVSQQLPFAEHSYDAVFANDVLCHVPERLSLLRELLRVLKPGGRMLFSDALIVGGMVSQEEIATRSSIGFYLFSPYGENERLIELAGFRLLQVADTTENAAQIAMRWHDARQAMREELIKAEGQANFEGVQKFLLCVHTLTSERRLLRCVYLAQKPDQHTSTDSSPSRSS
ncbi:MAG TPA: methyltransferase domain-containing protein [Terriglobales bacterium]|jgi:ubiquinone/menaquinone biosynthesis C-methylase UbiE|nr:methyltransferase domain-containing protein [Terriglobales bacterium]